MSETCWCGRDLAADDCCAPYLSGAASPPTAEALMRARYSAFVTKNADFLRRSWHPSTCPQAIHFDPAQRWLGLKVIDTRLGGMDDAEGEVKFAARYKVEGRGYRQEETSSFTRVAGRWVYVGAVLGSE